MTGREWLRRLWPWGAAATSGFLLALCFPGWDEGWLCWIALTPLIAALWFSTNEGRARWLKKAALGFCTGLIFFCTVFFWLTTVTNLMEPHALGFAAWFGLMCYLAFYFALWGWFAGCVVFDARTGSSGLLSSRHNLRLGFLCAAAWVAHEWLRGTVFSGFGWNGLGVALHKSIALIQVADITGVWGLSFLVSLVNIIAVITVRRFALEIRNGKLRPHYDFSLTLALVGIVFAYGVHALLKHAPTKPLRVAAVQANIPQDEKFDDAFEQKIFDRYAGLTDAAVAMRPQLLIWPEVATPRGMFADQVNHDFIFDTAAKGDFDFLFGTVDSDTAGDYNIAVLLTNRGRDFQAYRKMHLVPFGEYIPLRHAFPLFAQLAGDLVPGDFRPGTEHTVMQTKNSGVKIGALICFEDTLGDLTRHFVLNGAQVLVNLTNDGWFLKSHAAEQHLAHAVFRAAETHRPLIRCANTGVTCFIDASGRVTQSLRSQRGDPFTTGVLFGSVNVPAENTLTFYTRYGDWFPVAMLFITLASITAHFVKSRARR